jgi:hypothetical protein
MATLRIHSLREVQHLLHAGQCAPARNGIDTMKHSFRLRLVQASLAVAAVVVVAGPVLAQERGRGEPRRQGHDEPRRPAQASQRDGAGQAARVQRMREDQPDRNERQQAQQREQSARQQQRAASVRQQAQSAAQDTGERAREQSPRERQRDGQRAYDRQRERDDAQVQRQSAIREQAARAQLQREQAGRAQPEQAARGQRPQRPDREPADTSSQRERGQRGHEQVGRDRQGRGDDRRHGEGWSRDGRGDAAQRLDRDQQHARIRDDRARAQQYRQERARQQAIAAQRAAARERQLQQQRRMAQYRYQQQYYARLRAQQMRWHHATYDYYRDPFYYTPASHRYLYAGSWHQTNRYGAQLLERAVSIGYEEGLYAGRADREDGWRYDYRGSEAYQDALYGYDGYYVAAGQYRHYFREGFQRGYEDGYYGRYRHGRRDDDGHYRVLATVLGVILGIQLLR